MGFLPYVLFITAKRGARFFFYIYDIIKIHPIIIIVSDNDINMEDIISFDYIIIPIYR